MRNLFLGISILALSQTLIAKPKPKIIPEQCTPEKELSPPLTGFILYFDRMSRFLEEGVVLDLLREKYFDYLSIDDLSTKYDLSHHRSAHIYLRHAIELAKQGRRVLLDAVILRDYFDLVKNEGVPIVTLGVWCPLECLRYRFTDKIGDSNSILLKNVTGEYNLRYRNMTKEEIFRRNGAYFFGADKMMKYDLFYDGKTVTAKKIMKDLRKILEVQGVFL